MMFKIPSVFGAIGLFIAILYGCQNNTGKTVNVKTLTVYGDTIYLESIPFEDNPARKIDSAVITGDLQEVVWHIPDGDEAIYKIRSKKMYKASFLFVADVGKITIDANFVSPVFKAKGSPATTALNKYLNDRIILAEKGRQINSIGDSLLKVRAPKTKLDSVKKALNQSLFNYFDYSIKFADTVHSPAVFLQVYYDIDFGPERDKLKSYILKAAARFPNYKPIQKLKKDELATIKIYEEEYNIGDILPDITLPDQNGFNIATSAYKGKYYLIDFWASWCQQCLPFKEAERSLLIKTAGKINIVSVAIDSQRDDWNRLIHANQYTWPQLIDEGMWKGTAVRTLKFDSIPFNFLVDPKGKIIAKALNASNLEKIVQSHLK
jgi:peroxiredoxin